MNEHDKGLVEDLKEKLYKRGTFKADVSRSRFSLPRNEVETDWQGREETVSKGILSPQFLKKFFVFALLFFVLAILASAYVIWSGSNVISANNLDITLKGPTSIKGGDELNLGLVISNNNTTNLESADLIVTFPSGTREAGNLENELVHYRKNLGTIKKGDVVNESVKAVLFGESGTEEQINVAIDYRTPGSNAIFEKTKVYTVLLSSSPLVLDLSIPDEAHAGAELDYSVDVTAPDSNLSNILVQADYPSGFRFKSATPKPSFGTNVWDLGDMKSNTKRTISIQGTIDGQNDEKKLFRITAGTAAVGKDNEVGVPYGSTFSTVLMRRSFVDLSASLSGQSDPEIDVDPGDTTRASVAWTNNLPDKLINATVSVKFTGTALDQARVSTASGSYRSLDNTITWTQQHDDQLAVVNPGESGQIAFDFGTLDTSKLEALAATSPYIKVDITFSATRVTQGGPGDAVQSTVSKMVRLNSQVALVSRGLYSTGPFTNTGPMPPRANQETTYTITWSLSNSTNDLENTTVRGVLPSHARFLGNISPSGTDIRYDSNTGVVTWNVGRLPAGLTSGPVKEASFQVSVLPSITQVGASIPLVTNMKIEGRDLFTGNTLSSSLPVTDIRIVDDPNFQETWSKVTN